jgi:Rrf2 family protein
MELTNATQFALRTVLDLAVGGPSHVAEIAARRGIPPAQAGKIVQRLVRRGLVRTTRGARGGVRLGRGPEAITLRQVVEAIEGPIVVGRCAVWDDCPCVQPCPVRTALARVQQSVEKILDGVRLSELVAEERLRASRVTIEQAPSHGHPSQGVASRT